ncbi:hypothetical protein ACFL2V_10020 [Pseudomonadota bacterium]
MSYESDLEDFEKTWKTALGVWHPGEGVTLRGRDLFSNATLKNSGWMGQILFSITGRDFSEDQINLFEEMWRISTSYPDPRIWNNQVAALAGTARSTPYLGIGAAIAVSQAEIYGGRPFVRCMDFLLRAKKKLNGNFDLLHEIIDTELNETKEIYGNSRIYGFGRPLVTRDERIAPMKELIAGYSKDSYLNLAFKIEEIVRCKPYELTMNVAAIFSAVAADQNLTVRQSSTFSTLCFSAGFLACYQDAMEHPEDALFPIRCESIKCTTPVLGNKNW